MNVGLRNVVIHIRNYNSAHLHSNCNVSKNPPWSALFFGTDDFSLYSLKALHKEFSKGNLLRKLEVVTTSKGKPNIVRKYAEKHQLPLHSWPLIANFNTFDIGLVVSFGHLIPEHVINEFSFGMLNVHASLLPRWRGAAPIIHALAKGDKETGITIMRVQPKHFDIGEVVCQECIPIPGEMKMPELHEKLGILGADALVRSLRNLPGSLRQAKPQAAEGVTFAPKLTANFTVIDWRTMSSEDVYNLGRALEGLLYPTAKWGDTNVKLYDLKDCGSCNSINNIEDIMLSPGFVRYDKKSDSLRIVCANQTCVNVGKIAIFGKKFLSARDFNNGYLKKKPVEKRFFT